MSLVAQGMSVPGTASQVLREIAHRALPLGAAEAKSSVVCTVEEEEGEGDERDSRLNGIVRGRRGGRDGIRIQYNCNCKFCAASVPILLLP